jgi:short-subunit dehydrogenase
MVGASAGLGRALAEALAGVGWDVFLVASDERDLQALCAHLRLVHGVRAAALARGVSAGPGWAREVRAAAEAEGPIDALLFPVGASRDDDRGALGEQATMDLLGTNLAGVMHLVAAMLPGMLERRGGCIVGFGSIAAARGRGQNVVYSAAKSALRTYFQSLRHIGDAAGVRVHFYTVGYMDTQQSYGKRLPLPVASPQSVARRVVAELDQPSHSSHVPRFWALVELIVRLAPFSVFKRLKA